MKTLIFARPGETYKITVPDYLFENICFISKYMDIEKVDKLDNGSEFKTVHIDESIYDNYA